MHKRLGEILLAAGVVDAHQLQAALAEAALLGHRVGEVLVRRGDCGEEQILTALARQLGVEIAPLSTTALIPERILRLVPAAFAHDRLVLPLFLDGATGVLEVALADPADQETLDELRFRTGHEIRAMVGMASELREALERFYPPSSVDATAAHGALRGGLKVQVGLTPPPAPMPPVDMATDDGAPELGSDALGVSPETGTSDAGHGDSVDASADDLTYPEGRAVRDWVGGVAATGAALEAELSGALARVATLETRLDRVFSVLAEVSAAQTELISLLADRGLVNEAQYQRRLEERLAMLGRD